jgi:Uma2 family endonuclease
VIEMLFRIDAAANLQRRPDVAFVSYERWPRSRRVPEDAAWDVVPELAIEVVSPTNLAEDLLAKVGEYLRVGVRQVWVIYPAAAQVHVHESPTHIRVLGRGDELDGGPLLPGFRLPLAELFEAEADPA